MLTAILETIVKSLTYVIVIMATIAVVLYTAFLPEITNVRWHLDNCDTAWVSNDTLGMTCNNGKIILGSQAEIFVAMTR